ncbi:CsgG/HfaB family protein [Sporomusa malonica]|uniref:Curli biogenesis system outer membrane secretion channel CsgG n=1 Tax=Sporomusa malonica TaxID=112901 RepID=A0A1W2CBE7_9FIRM|nr:CsgG/HfaB family protein [Sporomusa malonica]SMC82202.1 Curli biogenesis system outer membrane secretion channel CsgG [Sporomusa malonica]
MKHYSKSRILFLITILIFIVSISLPQAVAAADSGLKYTIVVSKFENRSNWSGQFSLGDAWGTVLTDILNQSGKFIVLAENDMRIEAANERNSNPHVIPAQLLVKGVITHVQNTGGQAGGLGIGGIYLGGSKSKSEINITMYIVEAGTGQVLASKSVIGKAEKGGMVVGGRGAVFGNYGAQNLGKAVENAASQGVEWMITQLPKIRWTGAVVMNNNGQIYINRGTREGVRMDQEFIVGSAEVLRDPTTGEALDEMVTERARIRVVSVKEKISICEVISGSSESINQGMRVSLP